VQGHHQVGQLGLGVGEVRAVTALPLQVINVDPAEVRGAAAHRDHPGRAPQVAAAYKRAALADLTRLGRLIHHYLGELVEHDSGRLAAGTVLVAGALWEPAQPSAAVLAAYESDPALAVMRTDFTSTLREVPRY
jgi:hypothetical protein